MDKYEDFSKRNQCWDSYYTFSDYYGIPENRDKDPMRKNYAIAQKVCKQFYANYDANSAIPQIGDIVEFSDGYHVYKHAMVAESYNKEHDSKFNLLSVCENGSSWTDGECFSTSGGAFHTIHASRFALAGRAENVMWTWGCHGSGWNQGIYFKLNVRKWVIPYDAPRPLTRVHIYGKDSKDADGNNRRYAVHVGDNINSTGECFDSIRAFEAWAHYVGFTYEHIGRMADRHGHQFLKRVSISNPSQVPVCSKPLKLVENGTVVDAWTKKIGDTIYFYVPNINFWKNGSFGEVPKLSQDEDLRLFLKYSGNPLGI